ncbi:hypothetical protein ASE04_18960 [Rhizobium sp. Root708]|nr:hypothetical protein ASE04_18960 [Rhizobium sp. Root708]
MVLQFRTDKTQGGGPEHDTADDLAHYAGRRVRTISSPSSRPIITSRTICTRNALRTASDAKAGVDTMVAVVMQMMHEYREKRVADIVKRPEAECFQRKHFVQIPFHHPIRCSETLGE